MMTPIQYFPQEMCGQNMSTFNDLMGGNDHVKISQGKGGALWYPPFGGNTAI